MTDQEVTPQQHEPLTPLEWLKAYRPVLLVIAVLALLPVSRLAEIPLVIIAALGIKRLWQEGWLVFVDDRAVLLTLVFLAYWIPIVISAPDAAHPEKTWLLVAAMPRYWLAGIYALAAMRIGNAPLVLWRLCAWLLVLWSVDALVQAMFGYNLLGYPYPEQRLNGIFGQHNFKLGAVLALFSPFLIEHTRRFWPAWATWFAVGALAAVVLLTTTRIGWVFLGLVALAYFALYFRRAPARTAMVSAVLAVAVLGGGFTAYQASGDFRNRVDSTLRIFDGSRAAVNEALSIRLPIWESSLAMAGEHWFNGVGARSYRHAYPEYADRGDPWVRESDDTGATYAHHLVLELLTETGIVGFTGFCVLVWFMVRSWRRSPKENRTAMFPYALALAVAVFPINSHYALYSTFWSITLWWLVMGYCAASPREYRRSP